MNLVKLAQRFVRLSGELHATRDAMSRLLLLNGTGSPNENPTPARRPGAKRPQSGRSKMVAAAQVEQTIFELLRLSPGLRTAAIAKATAAQRSTADERLKRLQANGLIERDDASAGWRAPCPAPQCERWIKPLVVYDFRQLEGMKMMTLSANAQRIGDDIMRLVNAGSQSGSGRSER